jgi:threonine aldolase
MPRGSRRTPGTARRGFASDNNAGVHPEILRALVRANPGHVVGYGEDAFTEEALALFRRHFGSRARVYPVFTGTAANVLCLRAMTRSHHAVVCAESAHLQVDECGAPEAQAGCKLLAVPAPDGKLTPDSVGSVCHGIGDQHHVQPRVISIAQSTELGTLYRPQEVRALARWAHARGMLLHMDGARISNAAAALGLSLAEASGDLGVDALSFGGTKNGLMGADAVVLFNPRLDPDFRYLRKQGMQLASKMRYLSVQLGGLLGGDLWLRNARRANRMARRLESAVRGIPGVQVVYPVEANAVFARVPPAAIRGLRKRYFFYTWDESRSIVRWMCSWDTSEADIRSFALALERAIRKA